jgi:ankyrin repeat protein
MLFTRIEGTHVMKNRCLLLVALSASITMHPMHVSLFGHLKSLSGHVATIASKCSSALSLVKEHKALAFGVAAAAGLVTLAYKIRLVTKRRNEDLMQAVILGDIPKIQSLLEAGADVNAVNKAELGRTPLNIAAELGDHKVVRILIRASAQTELTDELGWTPLHNAVRKGAPEAIQELLRARARIDALDKYGLTPLHAASEQGHLKAVQVLLGARADFGARDNFNKTPLHYAASSGNLGVVQALVGAGANKYVQDYDGRSPQDLAQAANFHEIVAFLNQ